MRALARGWWGWVSDPPLATEIGDGLRGRDPGNVFLAPEGDAGPPSSGIREAAGLSFVPWDEVSDFNADLGLHPHSRERSLKLHLKAARDRI